MLEQVAHKPDAPAQSDLALSQEAWDHVKQTVSGHEKLALGVGVALTGAALLYATHSNIAAMLAKSELTGARLALKLGDAVGSRESSYQLGNIYANGLGVIKNDEIAGQFFNTAASRGHTLAQYEMAVRSGDAGMADKGMTWFETANEGNRGRVASFLAKSAPPGSIGLLKTGAYLGSDSSAFALGNVYSKSLDPERAIKYFGMAAKRGHPESQYQMVLTAYSHDEPTAAHFWLMKASESGHPIANFLRWNPENKAAIAAISRSQYLLKTMLSAA